MQELLEDNSILIGGIDFTPEEKKALNQFFESRIANKTDINEATRQFEHLLDDRQINEKFRNRIIESFLYASDSVSL